MEDNSSEWTTLSLKKATRKELKKLKIHPNQSYDEVIKQILKKGGKNDRTN